MAVCVFFKRKNTTAHSLKSIINYILDDEKTTEDLSFGFGVTPKAELAFDEMMSVKRAFNKTDKRQYIHFAISFKEGEITPELTKEISIRIAQYYAKDYQVLIAVHTDKPHLHCHFAINSVNINTGRKFKQSKGELRQFKEFCNKIFAEYNVSLIEKMNDQSETTGETRTKMRGEIPWKDVVRTDIKNALNGTTTKTEFIQKMHNIGYDIKWTAERKNITFTTPHGKKVRDSKLGYSKEKFEHIFSQNHFNAIKTQKVKSFTNVIKSILPTAPDIINMPIDVIPPEVDHLSPIEQLIALTEFYNRLTSVQSGVSRHNEDEQKRLENQRAFDGLLDILDETIAKLKYQTQQSEEDEDWDMEL